jgi:hypothetical protein
VPPALPPHAQHLPAAALRNFKNLTLAQEYLDGCQILYTCQVVDFAGRFRALWLPT